MATPFWKTMLFRYFPVLTFRTDSLLVQTTVAAAAYYAPQDAGVLALIGLNEKTHSKRKNGPVKSDDLESDYQAFLR